MGTLERDSMYPYNALDIVIIYQIEYLIFFSVSHGSPLLNRPIIIFGLYIDIAMYNIVE